MDSLMDTRSPSPLGHQVVSCSPILCSKHVLAPFRGSYTPPSFKMGTISAPGLSCVWFLRSLILKLNPDSVQSRCCADFS